MKKILGIVLVLLMLVSVMPMTYAEGNKYKVGDIIQFGSYPQSKVTDEALVAELNALAPEWDDWTSYGYYSSTGGGVGSMNQGDWMRYIDVANNGDKYRGVKFTEYRPTFTTGSTSYDYTFQDNNGYRTNIVYWFKFEPIDWRVLDPSTGFVICETIIDSQPYSNTVYNDWTSSEYVCFNDSSYTNFASDYETSSIRKWLNNDFYNIAFIDSEKKKINTTTLNNDGYYTSNSITGYEAFDSNPTNDKIFLLSYNEVRNSAYGFNSGDSVHDEVRCTQGSDYAKSQGLEVYKSKSAWHLRSPGDQSDFSCYVSYYGYSDDCTFVHLSSWGVRPALRFKLDSGIFNPEHTHSYGSVVTKQPTHLDFGEMTYTCECGDSYTEEIAKLTEHTYTSKITTSATHTKDGVETFTCACSDSYTKPVAKLEGHTYIAKVTKEPTHLATGVTTYTCECGDSYTKEIAKTADHNYSAVVTAPTCKTKGYTTYTCECGHSYVGDYVVVLKHNYTSVVTKNPTHLAIGKKTYTCSLCGDVYTEDIARTPEHTYSISNITEPTCTDKGYTTYTCACGDSYKDNYVSAKGHNYNGEICKSCGKKCTHMCHKSGFIGFIWKIVRFFCKLFKCKLICACGIAHY